jgi:hypothetical protein
VHQPSIARRLWAVLVTDGTVIEYAPELYASERLAYREAERWAWVLSASGSFDVERPFEGRLRAGFRDIRVVEVTHSSREPGVEYWLGTFWTSDGYPDPEAEILFGRNRAREWCVAPLPNGVRPHHVDEDEWHVAATFRSRGEDAHAVAHLAKLVCEP